MPSNALPYTPRRAPQSTFCEIRGLRYHVQQWGDASLATPERPPLVMVHGWMDVGASFQFVVDALAEAEGFERWVLAPDWRGFGLSDHTAGDSYWFPDYLGDLEALWRTLVQPAWGDAPFDLVGHSMGGNVVMAYGGTRPARIRRLVNLEGFGLPATVPAQAPKRMAQWLDEIATPQFLKDYASVDEVAERLMKNNPLLPADKAAWLAPHWSRPNAEGRWQILGDPAHKRANPVLYRVEEHLAMWRAITAPLLWVDGDRTDTAQWWGTRYPRREFDERLQAVPQVRRERLSPAGHMLHHDQPGALARVLADFLR